MSAAQPLPAAPSPGPGPRGPNLPIPKPSPPQGSPGDTHTLKRDLTSILRLHISRSAGVTALQQLAPTREGAPGKSPLPQETS